MRQLVPEPVEEWLGSISSSLQAQACSRRKGAKHDLQAEAPSKGQRLGWQPTRTDPSSHRSFLHCRCMNCA